MAEANVFYNHTKSPLTPRRTRGSKPTAAVVKAALEWLLATHADPIRRAVAR